MYGRPPGKVDWESRGSTVSEFFSGQENRRYKRWEIFEYAIVKSDTNPNPDPAVIVDLSLGGVQLRSRMPYSSGETCTVIITRDGIEPLEVAAEIRHSTQVEGSDLYATGVRFTPITVEQRVALVNYIHERFQADMERLGV